MFDFDLPVARKSKFWRLRNEARLGHRSSNPQHVGFARRDSIVLRRPANEVLSDELTAAMVACMPDAEVM